MRALMALLVISFCAAPAVAKSRFQPYEGADAVLEGKGGTRITKNGIDYWTSGMPPRRFKVLGLIEDRRGTGVLAGEAIGSKSVAKAAKQAGGDAVVFLSADTRMTGVVTGGQASAYGNQAYGSGWAAPVGRTTSKLAVVKYLE